MALSIGPQPWPKDLKAHLTGLGMFIRADPSGGPRWHRPEALGG